MVHDYAKRRSHKRRQKHIMLTIFVIVLAMVIPALLYYFKYQRTTHKENSPPPATGQKPHAFKHTSVKPEFDFYTRLPKMQVSIPQNSHKDSTNKTHYLLQVASFQDESQAKHLTSRLISLGYTSTIQRYQASDGTLWNRVMTGPFNSVEKAEKAQTKLHRQGINSLLLKATAG